MSESLRNSVAAILAFSLIAANIVSFFFGFALPISFNVSAIFFSLVSVYIDFRREKIGIVSMAIIAIYSLPFIHLIPYLWFDFSSSPLVMWGLASNPYSYDQDVIRVLCAMAATGVATFVLVNSLTPTMMRARDIGVYKINAVLQFKTPTTLATPFFLGFCAAALYLSYITAPSESVFISKYATTSSVSRDINFASAWVASYVLLIFILLDAIFESKTYVRTFKRLFALGLIGYISVGLQFLRGDRAVLTLILAVFLIYTYWCGSYRSRSITYEFKMLRGIMFVGLIFVTSFLIAAVRSNLSGQDLALAIDIITSITSSDDFEPANYIKGTWTAVLLTPLSVSGDYVNGILRFNYGEDYYNLLISTPPGFIADLLGFDRPFSNGQGPATEMRYGQGGTHALVLPFRTFGMAGIFVITALWYCLLQITERYLLARFNIFSVATLAMLVTMAPHWLWYGEKNIINGVIFLILISIIYLFFAVINGRRDFRYKFNREVMEIPFFGKYLSRMVPIADYKGRLPLNNRQLLEWAILDTFDMLSPKYDKPQSIETLRKWFYKYGLINTNVKMAEGLNGPTATGEKPK